MKPTLYPFQIVGRDFLLAHERCLLASEMGLGKSVQVLEAVKCIDQEKINILVVCPASLCLNWKAEINKWYSETPQIVLLKSQTDKIELTGKYRFIICSYQYLQKPKNVERLKALKWHVIVADEASYIKNWTSKTCRGFVKVCENHTGYVYLLTGTPATNTGSDYFPFLRIIEGEDKWGTLSEFQRIYCDKNYNIWAKCIMYGRIKESMRPKLRAIFSKIMLRHLKKDVAKQLPPKIVTKFPVEVDSDVIAESLSVDSEIIDRCIARGDPIPAHVAKVCTSIGLAKVSAAVEYINSCTEPLVVFATHREVVSRIAESIDKSYGLVTGDETAKQKQQAVDDFQAGKLDVIILNCAAGGLGINLTRSSHMLFVQLPWSAAMRDQCRDRCHRLTSTGMCINIVEMLGLGTIDEQIDEALESKSRQMAAILGDTQLQALNAMPPMARKKKPTIGGGATEGGKPGAGL